MVEIQLADKSKTIKEDKVSNTKKEEHSELYDTIIVGTGPAGYTAAIYNARYNLKTLVIGEEFGGQMSIDCEIENYPGFNNILGTELMKKFKKHAEDLGVKIIPDRVEDISQDNENFKITTISSIYYTKDIILALGTKRRKLGIPGEKEFTGRGVSYCATCDSNFYKDKIIAVIGGGDAAFSSAKILLKHAKKVYIIHRRDQFRARPGMVDSMKNNPKVEFIMEANVKEIIGDNKVKKIKTDNPEYAGIELDGVFIEIGVLPNTELVKKAGIELDDYNYIKVDEKQKTNIEGIYAAGDATTNSAKLKQIITASAEGAIASNTAFTHERECKHKLPGGKCDD